MTKQTKNTNAAVTPIATIPTEKKEEVKHYKLKGTPRGTKLFTYTMAALTYLGAFTNRRKVFQEKDLVSFYQTPRIIHHHVSCGNFEKTKTGLRLTKAGWTYFNGKLSGSDVSKKKLVPEVAALVEAIEKGKVSKSTTNYSVNTPFEPVK